MFSVTTDSTTQAIDTMTCLYALTCQGLVFPKAIKQQPFSAPSTDSLTTMLSDNLTYSQSTVGTLASQDGTEQTAEKKLYAVSPPPSPLCRATAVVVRHVHGIRKNPRLCNPPRIPCRLSFSTLWCLSSPQAHHVRHPCHHPATLQRPLGFNSEKPNLPSPPALRPSACLPRPPEGG